MTRKHYKLIAAGINWDLNHKPPSMDTLEHQAYKCGIEYVVMSLCTVFKRDNPNFNKDKFLEACGL